MKFNKYNAILTMLVFFWGLTFPVAKIMLEHAGVLPSLFFRYAIGSSIILIITVFAFRGNIKDLKTLLFEKRTVIGGLLIGLTGGFGMIFQIWGMLHTSASNSAFITGTYVTLIPFISFFFYKKKPDMIAIIGVLTVSVGLLFVSNIIIIENRISFTMERLNFGDLLTLFSAFCFAFQIIAIDKTVSKVKSFLPVTLWHNVSMLLIFCIGWIFFTVNDKANFGVPFVIVYIIVCAILGTAVNNMGLLWVQKRIEPTKAALILSLEPVFGAAAAMVIPNSKGEVEIITISQIVGSLIIFCAIVGAEYFGTKNALKRLEEHNAGHNI